LQAWFAAYNSPSLRGWLAVQTSVSAEAETVALASNAMPEITVKTMRFIVHPPILIAPIPIGRATAAHKFEQFRLQIGQDTADVDGN
jgi:hypothetical protein